ncbi:hypothetical protein [Paenibacillus sp. MMS18-CY102]|uniref:hypothetical protein n=1 Tax=Paenibacillus sp. MMS18-CY102 TaxID=2682849 RepID=UPI00136524B7|nr:hypothetical protein [Paenibacillus sp. MMS18-CY102]
MKTDEVNEIWDMLSGLNYDERRAVLSRLFGHYEYDIKYDRDGKSDEAERFFVALKTTISQVTK